MLSKTGFTHSDLLRWQNEYAGRSLNVNGTIMRDTYRSLSSRCPPLWGNSSAPVNSPLREKLSSTWVIKPTFWLVKRGYYPMYYPPGSGFRWIRVVQSRR
ncbi:hypothetical protein EH207_15505 [Brenneria rubrifaciens]|uniref:Uncharacterized protein n=1 Tax=Brenneria rubrifaciens TaxID=55213 RepID=A0A4P8QRP9_9GAMM|nr:hypothetical protein EH207_15505 [Brenneria rubrifaciens]